MILVTGASGNIGSALVRTLRERNATFRVAERDTPIDDRTSVRLNFLDPSSFAAAVDGCHAVFLLRPPAIARMKPTLNAFVDVARAAGVAHIVFVSVSGADRNPIVPHHAVEQHLQAGRRDWTILRPGFFAQNLIDAYRRDIVEDDRIYVPAGAARVSFIDARDIADVAATALFDPGSHRGCAYSLNGPDCLSFAEVAAILTGALDRAIEYVPASTLAYMAHLAKHGVPVMQIVVQTLLHVALRTGSAGPANTVLADLLGRPPRSMLEFVHDHVSRWARADEPHDINHREDEQR